MKAAPEFLACWLAVATPKFAFRAPFRPLLGSLGDLLGPAWSPWAVAGINLIEELTGQSGP